MDFFGSIPEDVILLFSRDKSDSANVGCVHNAVVEQGSVWNRHIFIILDLLICNDLQPFNLSQLLVNSSSRVNKLSECWKWPVLPKQSEFAAGWSLLKQTFRLGSYTFGTDTCCGS